MWRLIFDILALVVNVGIACTSTGFLQGWCAAFSLIFTVTLVVKILDGTYEYEI